MPEALQPWFVSSWADIVGAMLSTVATLAAIIGLTRLAGLRSFAKLSAFDFASTVAIGSIFAATATNRSVPLSVTLGVLATLFACMVALSKLRRSVPFGLIDNEPLLLVRDGVIILPAMRRANMTQDDLRAKLREANVLDPAKVQAVVMETTGDVSVLHGEGPLHADLLRDVRDVSRPEDSDAEVDYQAMTGRSR